MLVNADNGEQKPQTTVKKTCVNSSDAVNSICTLKVFRSTETMHIREQIHDKIMRMQLLEGILYLYHLGGYVGQVWDDCKSRESVCIMMACGSSRDIEKGVYSDKTMLIHEVGF